LREPKAAHGRLFCKIVAGERSARKLYEEKQVLAFNDIAARTPLPLLAMPEKHSNTLLDLSTADTLSNGPSGYPIHPHLLTKPQMRGPRD